MKFDYCIGNPPYQGDNHQQLYPDFYQAAKNIADCVDMIFPTGWQEPKNKHNLDKLNTEDVKADKQIVLIDNQFNVFNMAGANWTNIILWKRDYDNGLEGKQLVYTNSANPEQRKLIWDKTDIKKPPELLGLFKCVKDVGNFVSIQTVTTGQTPYGLYTNVITEPDTYGLPPMNDTRINDTDIKIYATKCVKYIPFDYPIPKRTVAMDKYKVFVPYAWGNLTGNQYLGGAYADVIVAMPNEICTQTYLESGSFDNIEQAKAHAKYLMSKFLRALLFINKFSRHSTTAWGAIPMQDYYEDFWNGTISEIDNALMDKYNVPQNIRDFVEKNIQTKFESNIVNYKESS